MAIGRGTVRTTGVLLLVAGCRTQRESTVDVPNPLNNDVPAQAGTGTLCKSLGGDIATVTGRKYQWDFDGAFGPPPPEFVVVLGNWQVETESTAPSPPNALRQKGAFAVGDFPRALVKDLTFADLTMQVRCRMESGNTDQACGLVLRAQDGCNYYVARANAKEGNTRFYLSVNGRRTQIGPTAATPLVPGTWYTLKVIAKGSDLTISLDGAQVVAFKDTTFARGKIGLWTKADSVTAFDALEASGD